MIAGAIPCAIMYVVKVRLTSVGETLNSFVSELRAGKYMFAETYESQ
jgi:hypothetical protein